MLVTAGRGDLSALAALYDRTAPVIYGLIRAAVTDTVTAQELTTRVYLQAWRTAPGYECDRASALVVLLGCARRHLTELGHPLPGDPAR